MIRILPFTGGDVTPSGGQHVSGDAREVALRLGIAEETLRNRLACVRALLCDRLAKRMLALSAVALAAGLLNDVSAAAVQIALHAGGVVPWSVTSLTEGVLKTMFLTRLKAGAVVLLASCTMASLTTLATERAQADRDEGRPVAALAAVARPPRPPQDPAADAATRAEKPPEAGGDGVVQSKGRILTPDGKLMYVNIYTTDPNADRRSLSTSQTLRPARPQADQGMGTAIEPRQPHLRHADPAGPRPHAGPQPVVRGHHEGLLGMQHRSARTAARRPRGRRCSRRSTS